jgi:phage/plasmid-associated DNA primase
MISWDFINILRKSGHDFSHLLQYISKVVVRERIVSDLKKRLQYDNFTMKMNAKKNIIGVLNGTLDLESMQVREPRGEDFISMNTKIPFYTYVEECNEVTILFKILKQIFPNTSVLSFFLRSCSTFLEGENSCKKLFVWWGMGNNVKTGMQSLVSSALGEYCGTAPVSMITSKRSGSSNATPDLAHLENKLVVFLQEPNQKEELRTGQIKELTGNDKIFIRGLYEKNAREIDIKCKLVLVVNYPNVGQNTDPAFKRRVVVIPFESIFLPEQEYLSKKEKGVLRENTFMIVEGMDDVFKALGPVFLWVLTKEYESFRKYGMKIEKVIYDKTEEFLTYNNYCLKYIRKNLKHVPSDSNGIRSEVIYEIFKNFMRTMYPGKAIPTNEIFCKELVDEDFKIGENGVVYGVEIQNYEINTPF